MNLTKKILIAIAILFVIIQFFQPARNKNGQVLAADISKVVNITDSVQVLLHNACYDCHSNNTNYPWYSNIQPIGWFLAKHITNGKDELNFSEFGGYAQRRQLSKLEGIAYNISENIMPLRSYRMMHKNAKLNTIEKALLIYWAEHSTDTLTAKK
jgi:hypothetical protein